MNLHERLRQIVAALPSDAAAVTFTRADLAALVAGDQEPSDILPAARDLTVEDVAERVGRAPSTVRGWLIDGKLRGYKLNARDWRVPQAALREFLDAQASAPARRQDAADVDISEWRKSRG